MPNWFMPDKIYDNVYQIDFDGLREKNIRCLIFDIDNTLVSYRQPEPTDDVIKLMRELSEKGFKICFVSNNNKPRVDLFNREFKFPAFAKARKPFKKSIKTALASMESEAGEAAIIGDQIFTDVWAGKRSGMFTIAVTPIEPVETLFFKFKRVLEKPVIKKYWANNK